MSSEKYIGLDVHQATISVAVLDSRAKLVMESIVETKKARVLALWQKERELNMPLSSLKALINDYRDLLLSIQKIKFDLGLDEYKGVIPGVKATAASVMHADGLNIQQQVVEAL